MKKTLFYLFLSIMLTGIMIAFPSETNDQVVKAKTKKSSHQTGTVRAGTINRAELELSEETATWARRYVGNGSEMIKGAAPISDGYILAGRTTGLGSRALTFKIQKHGSIGWKYIWEDPKYNIRNATRVTNIELCQEGGAVFTGALAATNLPLTGVMGKISDAGNIEWCNYYSVGRGSKLLFIAPTQDEGFIAAGLGEGITTDLYKDIWVVKINKDGQIQWQGIYGGEKGEADWNYSSRIPSITQTPDGGYLLAADSDSFSNNNDTDLWLLRLTEKGKVVWEKKIGGIEDESMHYSGPHIQYTKNNEIFLVGSTLSFQYGTGRGRDVWVIKLKEENDDVKVIWQKTYDQKNQWEVARSICATSEGGCVIVGITQYNYDPVHGFFLKVGIDGDVIDQQCYRSEGEKIDIYSIVPDQEGYILTGAIAGLSPQAMLVLKVSNKGELNGANSENIMLEPDFTIMNTDAVLIDTKGLSAHLVSQSGSSIVGNFQSRDIDLMADVICWEFTKPPVNVSLEQNANRGLFGGEMYNNLSWSPNPDETRDIFEYRIYRKEVEGDNLFVLVGTVTGNTLEFVDTDADVTKQHVYIITAVDSEGYESGWSEAVHDSTLTDSI